MRRGDWIESFISATENITSPLIFRKWAALSAIAGALERKVWVVSQGSKIYPNMYVFIVAPPGVGKTEVTWRVRDLWESLEDHKIASSSVSKASLMDELDKATRRWITNDPQEPVLSFNSLQLAVNELGVLLPGYENEFMNTLTDLWDCKHYSERKRTSNKEINIKAPQLNMFAACTPSYLNDTLPEGAWDQGFISRTFLIYSGERNIRPLFGVVHQNEDEWMDIKSGLTTIAGLCGEIKFTEEAGDMIEAFHARDGEPKPDHPKLTSYNIRRTIHLMKLCILVSVSSSNELIIRKEDFERAFDIMTEAELYMSDVFKAMRGGGTGKVIEEAWYFLYKTYMKEQKPIAVHRLIRFLQEHVPVHNIENTINIMERSKMIEQRLQAGGKFYVPKGKQNGD